MVDQVKEIDNWTNKLVEARNGIRQIHQEICLAAQDGRINPPLEDNIVDSSIWNNYGRPLIFNGMFSDAESVYSDMLATIKEVERRKGICLHKGLALYNIGLVQFLQHNFDEAIPAIREAYREDCRRLGHQQAQGQLAKKFMQDFRKSVLDEIDREYLPRIRKTVVSMAGRSASRIVATLSPDEFLFLSRIVVSNKHVRFRTDRYTGVVLFDNLKNLCLLTEDLAKRKTGRADDLRPILQAMFAYENWMRNVFIPNRTKTIFRAPTVQQAIPLFENNLKLLDKRLGGSPDDESLARCFLTTVLVRHFTAHYFDAYRALLRKKRMYTKILDRVMASFLYMCTPNL